MKTKVLIRLRECAGWSAPLLFTCSINSFSHDIAQITTYHVLTFSFPSKPAGNKLNLDIASINSFRSGCISSMARISNLNLSITVINNWKGTQIWAASLQNQQNGMCAQRRLRSALGIRPIWSEALLSAWRKLGSLATHWAHSEVSDQTGRMPRLIWVFTGHTVILLVLSWGGSNELSREKRLYNHVFNPLTLSGPVHP